MKLKVVFKTPDAIEYALNDLACSEDEELDAKELTKKFVAYGEYITVEFDTNTGTATVVPIA